MGKKRSHDFGGVSFNASQKKQKHSPSPSNHSTLPKIASCHAGQRPSHINEHQEATQNAAPRLTSDIDGEANDHQQAFNSTQTQGQGLRLAGGSSHVKHSKATGDHADLGKTFNFPQSSLSKSANAFVRFPPYSGHPSTLPPLPRILDKTLESVAFTHPGSLNCDTASRVNVSYDRLEFLGDAYIELMATRVIFPRFPTFTAGRLSQTREMLVKNETLAEYALAYAFDQKALLPHTFNVSGKDNRKVWSKTLGDLFEAFVAAVIISDPEQGFQVAEAWLTALWESKLGSQIGKGMETADPKAKLHLATKIMGKGVKVNYRDEGPPVEIRREGKLIFQIGVYLTGWGWQEQHLGSGKGLNKQEAGQKAAADALMNPLTAQVASVKKQFDMQLASERGVQEEAEKAKDSAVGSHN